MVAKTTEENGRRTGLAIEHATVHDDSGRCRRGPVLVVLYDSSFGEAFS